MICLLSKIDNEKIISPIVRSGEWCDQKGDRVSKNDRSWLIDSMRQDASRWTLCTIIQILDSFYK